LARVLVAGVGANSKMIPVLGFCTLKRFDLAERLLASIDYPVEHLVVANNAIFRREVSNGRTIRVKVATGETIHQARC